MRQLVGLACVLCGKPVKSILEGGFCDSCGCPVHARCVESFRGEKAPGGCPDCGATPEQVQTQEALHKRDMVGPGPQTWGERLSYLCLLCVSTPWLLLGGVTGILLVAAGVAIFV